MSTIVLKAKSSSGEPYDVLFEIGENIMVRCNCKAGIFGKLCKHKIGLLAGDEKILSDPSQINKLKELMEVIRKSEYPTIETGLYEAKKAVDMAKKAEAKIKRSVEAALKEGIRITTEN